MKNAALSFSILLACGSIAAAAISFAGCSSDPEAPVTPVVVDAGSDTKVVVLDTKPPAPISCQGAFEGPCVAPPSKTGATVCTDLMLNEFLDCFGTDGDEAKCMATTKKYPACNTCILTTWLAGNSIDVAACVKAIDPSGTCATAVHCERTCVAEVCAECDPEKGTGRTSTTSQLDNCEVDSVFRGSATKPKGKCYDLAAKEATACETDSRFAVCFITSKASLVNFWRGACRDKGDFITKVDVDDGTFPPPAGDAGTDTGTATDTGAAGDTGGATDTGTSTDSGSDSGVLPDLGLPG